MSTSVTSKEAILEACRQIVLEKGLSSLNMREVAKLCNIALGLIYYYFPSKNDLLIATIESVWEDIFRFNNDDLNHASFTGYIHQLFCHIQYGIQKYPNFFTIHSISFSTNVQPEARGSMENFIAKIKKEMLSSLHADKQVKSDAFSTGLTEGDFIEFVLSNVISLLVQKHSNCHVLLEVIRRTIY